LKALTDRLSRHKSQKSKNYSNATNRVISFEEFRFGLLLNGIAINNNKIKQTSALNSNT